MIGVDLVSIRRIESLVKKYDIVFLKKILNDDEISLVLSLPFALKKHFIVFYKSMKCCFTYIF